MPADTLSSSIVSISDSDEGTPVKNGQRKFDSDDDMFESTVIIELLSDYIILKYFYCFSLGIAARTLLNKI